MLQLKKVTAHWQLLSWVLVVGALGLRLPGLWRTWYVDELATLALLRAPTFWQAMQALRADTHHPGYFAPLYVWARGGLAVPWLRLFSLGFDAGTLLLLRQRLSRVAPLAACGGVLLWGLLPVALRNASELRPYAALSFCTLLSFLAARTPLPTARSAGWRWQLACAAAFAALVSMHPVGIMAVVAVVASVWLTSCRLRPWRWPERALTYALGLPSLAAGLLFVVLHELFALDPSGGVRIGWMPSMSWLLLRRILNNCYGLDALAYVMVTGKWSGEQHGLGLVCFVGSLLLAWRYANGRAAGLAAALYTLIVVAFSLLVRPIFWHRSLVPAMLLLCFGLAAQLPHWRAKGVFWFWLGSLPLLLWQLAGNLPRLQRAIDPSAVAGMAAATASAPGEMLLVVPDFMNIAVEPYLTQQPTTQVMGLQAASLPRPSSAPRRATCLVRGTLPADAQATSETLAALQKLRQAGVLVHDWLLFYDENDDLNAPSRTARQQLVQQINDVFGPCRVEDAMARVAHVRCTF